jgi:3-methyl-2-oxobutanoate hydroxymethyltransferase
MDGKAGSGAHLYLPVVKPNTVTSPTAGPSQATGQTGPATLRTLRQMAQQGQAFACLTCYDATTARWLARAGVPVLLVGDTAAEVVLGLPRTIDMPLDVLLVLTAAVKRGAPGCLVMGDMPFMSYQADESEGVRNAGRFLTQGLADIVKVEADASHASLIEKMTRAGIPVCGHIGSRPQQAALTGGYSSAGRTAADIRRLAADAVALEHAGCVMLLVEAVPDEATEQIMASTSIPLIGIGAGPACHGQVLVLQDLFGLSDHPPRFAEPVAQLGEAITRGASEWVQRVSRRQIGGRRYILAEQEAARLAGKVPPGNRGPESVEGIGGKPA